ncbi:MAG: LAGLIDADG family homing endonuclease, partial [Candidatus Aenigmarchaeota archaeon]|nr:LAGLIDADG family homing endonuclease [Candidatus Aenigmarchaeota archaeon]MDI6722317.1 LAGLIDADG family homing endonuclease [Candidatus Aenigmarchaeota archaeon]
MEDVQKMEEFIREKYYADLLKAAKEDKALAIDFSLLDRFDPVIADQLLESPRQVLDVVQKAAGNFGLEEKISIRIRNLPESRNIRIRNLRAKHMNRLWCIDAIIKSASEVKPQIYEATFACPECGTKIVLLQEGNLVKRPFSCECGRRGDFGEPVDKKMFDVRWLTGVEPFEITTGEQPGEMRIILKEDLTTPKMQKKTDPGSRLKITGSLIEAPKYLKGKLSTKMDTFFEALHVETKDIEFEDLDITPEDEKRIKEISDDPKVYDRLKLSIAPGIYGFDEIKESIALQLFGGIRHRLPDGNTIRGNIHILLTGDPGIGKSVIGSSKILHNSGGKLEYIGIGDLVDNILKSPNTLKKNVEIGLNITGIKVITFNPLTHTPEWKYVTAFVRHKSPKKLLRVRTAGGREIISTKDHSFVTINEKGDIVSIEGSDINSNIFLPVPLNTHKEMARSMKINQKIRTNAKILSDEIKFDWNFGFFVGMFVSEGSAAKGNIYINTNNLENKNKLSNFLRSIGLNPNFNYKSLLVSSRNLQKFMEKNCYNGEKSGYGKGSGARRKCIPSFAFFAPKEFIFGLLSGLFSGDGYFHNTMPKTVNRTIESFRIGYTTVSESLALQLIELLSSIGIFSVLRRKKYKYRGIYRRSFEIAITGDYATKFLRNVTMIGKKPIASRISGKDSFDCIPCVGLIYEITKNLGYLRRLPENSEKRRAFAAMMRTVKSRGRIGRRRLQKIYDMFLSDCRKSEDDIIKEKIEKLGKILKSNIVWDRVVEVGEIDSKEKYVYDLSIEGNENFSANNIIVHNSMFLKLVSGLVPRGKYVSGSGVTGAGITATVRKDEILGGWVLEAGALILTNKGIISIDEFDKIGKDDQIAMHEAMSIESYHGDTPIT